MFEEKSEYINSSVASSSIFQEEIDKSETQIPYPSSDAANAGEKSYLNSLAAQQALEDTIKDDHHDEDDEPIDNPKSLGQDNNLYLQFDQYGRLSSQL